jgi:hypothetical protein
MRIIGKVIVLCFAILVGALAAISKACWNIMQQTH